MDLICFSHLRWNFVYQRPQHLLSRMSSHYRIFFVEEPIHDEGIEESYLEYRMVAKNILIVVPKLPVTVIKETEKSAIQQSLLVNMFDAYNIHPHIFWYYTPMSLPFTRGFSPDVTVYDCMDELANFDFAPQGLVAREIELFEKADIVFTGGHNLYEAKKSKHTNIWPVPSSIEKEHFSKARTAMKDPEDQAHIPSPRIGYSGVIDERMDLETLRAVAEKRPDWNFVMLGPVVKIDESKLPKLPNIHYLGSKKYDQLPYYFGGWDIGMIPFLLNAATKYISPTKTPEYLAAGIPVVSSAIVDVVNPYGNKGLVHVYNDADDFISGVERTFSQTDKKEWLSEVDTFLSTKSWDNTAAHMRNLINQCHAKLAGLKHTGKALATQKSIVNV